MYVRTAYFCGTLDAAGLDQFRRHMTDTVAPIIATFPGSRRFDMYWPDERDPEAPADLILTLQHFYDDRDALQAALASPQRLASMEATQAILKKLDCRVYHVNYHFADMTGHTA